MHGTRAWLGPALLAAVLLGVAALGAFDAFLTTQEGDPDPPDPQAPLAGRTEAPPAGGPSLSGRGPEAPPETAPVAPTPVLPPPVALDRCDPDRDLCGVVVQRDGAPVAGAHVQVLRHPLRQGGILTRRGYWDVVAGEETLTAHDGTFRLRLPPGDHVTLRVAAAGLATADFAARSAGERVRLVLPPPVALAVRTVDEEGTPLPGTWVRLFCIGGAGGDVDYAREATTGEDGRLVFEGLHGDREIALDAKHPSHGSPGWTPVTLVGEGLQEHTLVLPRGRTVRGVVTDRDTGAPLAGAQVGGNWTIAYPVTTDAEGRYVFDGWTGIGSSTLTALAAGHAPEQARVGSEDTVDFALAPAGRAEGRVVDARSRPVAGALVASRSVPPPGRPAAAAYVTAITDAAGEFVLEGVRTDADLDVVAMAPGHAREGRRIPADVLAGGEADLGVLRLLAERQLAGVVVGADGTPRPRTQVFLARLEQPGAQRWAPTRYGHGDELHTDDRGRFRFRGLGEGPYRLVARPTGRAEQSTEVHVPAERDVLDVRMVLPETREVRIHAEHADGTPFEGLAVSGLTTVSQAVGVGGRTDADGDLVLQVSPDVVRVAVSWSSEQHERYVLRSQDDLELTPTVSTIRLVVDEAVLTRGRVQDEAGGDVGGLVVRVRERPHLTAVADAEGRFALRTPRGEVLTVACEGWRVVTTVAGSQTLVTPLRGRVERVLAGSEGTILWVAAE